MSEAQTPTIYRLHQTMRHAMAAHREACDEVDKAREGLLRAERARERALEAFEAARNNLIVAPGGLPDHLDALAGSLSEQALPADEALRLAVDQLLKSARPGDRAAGLQVGRVLAALEHPNYPDTVAVIQRWYDDELAKLAPSAPAPATVEPGLPG
jgi:hypothetical protein